MHDIASWSVSLGRWGGLQIRVHALFVLFAIGTVSMGAMAGEGLTWVGYALVGLLFLSVLLHELGHCYAAFREGGDPDQIVIGPLGGLAPIQTPHEPRAELFTALAGPTVNFTISATLAIVLAAAFSVNPLPLLHPLMPMGVTDGGPLVATAKLALWLNWVLLLVNLLPAFPFDGGQMLRSLLWQSKGYRTSVLIVAAIAKATAVVLLIAALLIMDEPAASPIPTWGPLAVLAAFLYFSAKQEVARLDRNTNDEEYVGYDFSPTFSHFDSPAGKPPSLLAMWRKNRQLQKQQRRREREAADEARVDEILARLHECGIEGLPAEDRAILQRVSARYRSRQGS
jgi:Zn-dependent protease